MPSITERNGKWLARIRMDGFSLAKSFNRKTDAQAWARRTESDIQAGKFIADNDRVPTLSEAVGEYRMTVVQAMKGADVYAFTLDELQTLAMAAKAINEVTASDVSTWRDQMTSRGLAAGTVVRRLGLLSGLMSWAYKERGWITGNPVHSIRKPKANDARDRVLTVDEQKWLIEGARAGRNEWLADALAVLLESAMRRGELWGLRVADVDVSRNVAHLSDTKNGTARDVPLSQGAVGALQALMGRASAEGARLRRSGAAGAPAEGHERLIPVGDAPAVSLAFRRAVRRAVRLYSEHCKAEDVKPAKGFLEGVRLHDCRHTSVTRWASTGALSVHELMAVSGHKTTAMLARYVNLKAEDLAAKLHTLAD